MKLVLNYKWYDKEQKKRCSTTTEFKNIWKFQINKRSINYWMKDRDYMLTVFTSDSVINRHIEILEDDEDENTN